MYGFASRRASLAGYSRKCLHFQAHVLYVAYSWRMQTSWIRDTWLILCILWFVYSALNRIEFSVLWSQCACVCVCVLDVGTEISICKRCTQITCEIDAKMQSINKAEPFNGNLKESIFTEIFFRFVIVHLDVKNFINKYRQVVCLAEIVFWMNSCLTSKIQENWK